MSPSPERDANSHVPPAAYEGHLEVARTARYSQLGGIRADTRQIWFVCHGYRQLAARFVTRFRPLVERGCVVVAPEALSRFYIDVAPGRHGSESRIGASWMTRADRETEIRDYVRYLDKLAGKVLAKRRPEDVRVVGLGFSQGAHTAARWAAMGSTPLDALVLWGNYLPTDVSLGGTQPPPRLHLIYGDEDPTRDASLEQSQNERLAAEGLDPHRWRYSGGHHIHDGTLIRLSDAILTADGG